MMTTMTTTTTTIRRRRRGSRLRDAARRAKANVRSAVRARGLGKRSKAFDPPLPLEYKTTATGFQLYRLPGNTRACDRRTFDYSDQYKVNGEVHERPAPPTLFCDKYFFKKATYKITATDDGDTELTPHAKLVHRVLTTLYYYSHHNYIGAKAEICAKIIE